MASGGGGGAGGHDYFYAGRSGNFPSLRYNQQFPQIFLDQTTSNLSVQNQIPFVRNRFNPAPTPASYIGKRTLAEFQTSQNNVNISSILYPRSVKPRSILDQYHQPSSSGLYRQPQTYLNQQLLQPPRLNNRNFLPPMVHQPSLGIEKKLQELEKELFEDEDGNDIVSVVTTLDNDAGSEWSEALNLISQNVAVVPNSISASPTTSSSSSSSVSNPVSSCSRQSVLEAAAAIADGKNDVAMEILTRCSPPSTEVSSEQKLLGFLTKALYQKITTGPSTEIFTKEHSDSVTALYQVSPCFKLCFMAANLAIVKATREFPAFTVLDFDIRDGAQFVDLLNGITVARASGSATSRIKFAAVVDSEEEEERTEKVGEMLQRIGERVGVAVCFKTVLLGNRLNNLSRSSMCVDDNEPLAVNFPFKLYSIPDESVSIENPRDQLLRRVKDMSPVVVTLLEQEMNINTAPFLTRVGELCAHYGAMWDYIELSEDGTKAESCLGRRITNSVTCEGRERVERCEMFGKWRSRFGMAGYLPSPFDQGSTDSILAGSVNPGLTVHEENGVVCMRWMGKTLTVASAWR